MRLYTWWDWWEDKNPSMGEEQPNKPMYQRLCFLTSLPQCCQPLKTGRVLASGSMTLLGKSVHRDPLMLKTIFDTSLLIDSIGSKMSLILLPWKSPEASSSVSRVLSTAGLAIQTLWGWMGRSQKNQNAHLLTYNKSCHIFILANQQKTMHRHRQQYGYYQRGKEWRDIDEGKCGWGGQMVIERDLTWG